VQVQDTFTPIIWTRQREEVTGLPQKTVASFEDSPSSRCHCWYLTDRQEQVHPEIKRPSNAVIYKVGLKELFYMEAVARHKIYQISRMHLQLALHKLFSLLERCVA
jgi:hypothetical protein